MRTFTHIPFSQIELQILRGIVKKEQTSQEIAGHLGCSIRVVERHRSSMLKKANVKMTIGLILFAVDRKIIKLRKRKRQTHIQ